MPEDVRRDERVPIDVEVRFRYPEVFSGRMKDFCTGGLGVQIPITMDIDSPVEVEIFEGRLLASGHVRWMRFEEGSVRIGVQFREGDRSLIEQIQAWKGVVT